MNYCGFNIEPFCSDVCGDHRCPQTLTEICRNMGMCCGFRAVAAKGKYLGFILFTLIFKVKFNFKVKSELEVCLHNNSSSVQENWHTHWSRQPKLIQCLIMSLLSGLGSIPFFQFNSNSFTFNSNSNSFGMKNSNSNSFLSIPILFYQFLFNSFLKPN